MDRSCGWPQVFDSIGRGGYSSHVDSYSSRVAVLRFLVHQAELGERIEDSALSANEADETGAESAFTWWWYCAHVAESGKGGQQGATSLVAQGISPEVPTDRCAA